MSARLVHLLVNAIGFNRQRYLYTKRSARSQWVGNKKIAGRSQLRSVLCIGSQSVLA